MYNYEKKYIKMYLTWTALFKKQLFCPGAFNKPLVVVKATESLERAIVSIDGLSNTRDPTDVIFDYCTVKILGTWNSRNQ